MSIPDLNPSFPGIEAMADAQLQQELYSLFLIDTQSYLQTYHQIAQHLYAQSWKTDIQELYRCIHTIKGGAVTVAAETVLQVATALEDLLSELRYLDVAPPLDDGNLCQALLEAGELLIGTLDSSTDDPAPILNRIQTLHHQIQTRYLPHWNGQQQLHQEFAEQGLDLVVLELEIALEHLPDRGTVPDTVIHCAQQTRLQLQEIGRELQLATGWVDLLNRADRLFTNPNNAFWRSQWPRFFQALKICAKQGGSLADFEFTLEAGAAEDESPADKSPAPSWALPSERQADSTDGSAVEQMLTPLTVEPETTTLELQNFLDTLTALNDLTTSADIHALLGEPDRSVQADIGNFLNEPDRSAPVLPLAALPESPFTSTRLQPSPEPARRTVSDVREKAQIPVSLEKLDRSAQHLVETLLALRTTQGAYQVLENQLLQLVTIAQEEIQHITQLRHIQDDYALLDDLRNHTHSPQDIHPERYRQGYTVINRLLESSLRLSELGAEAGKTAQQITEHLRTIDNSVLKLQTTVEESRLVSFQTLGLRARAIVRDLITRYGKPVQLTIHGEQTELDAGITRDLEPALLHLIRNAYAHGLETPGERSAQGKPAQGTMTIDLQRQGNTFQLEFSDDGQGIDASAVQARAEKLGLPLTETHTPADLLAVICQPGFSSQTQANDIAGRGVGMDVVVAQMARLGGQLTLHTVPGSGTTFRLRFPVPRLLVPCLVLQAEEQTFAIPIEEIGTIALFSTLNTVRTTDIHQHYTWMIEDEAGTTPVIRVSDYWHARVGDRLPAEMAVCAYVRPQDGQSGLWLLADELLEQTDLLINPLPEPLIAPEGVIGVSLQTNGLLIPVLDARGLAAQMLTAAAAELPPTAIEPEAAQPDSSTILIVDDAALIRRRLESSLNAYGYTTHTCTDGREAWNWLQDHPRPSLVITDIEMPLMDGFTLIDRCRQSEITIPILVISSRLSEEWFSEARRLGATDYLTKGFSTVELINKVNMLLNAH